MQENTGCSLQFESLVCSDNLTAIEETVKPEDFTYLKVLGKGSFGKVMMAEHNKSKKVYAIKVRHNVLSNHVS